MSFAKEEICQITTTIWKSILDIDIQPQTQTLLPDESAQVLSSWVQISGA